MDREDKINILLVDDQPAKLLSYEAILRELGENLLTADSARAAFEHLLRAEVAVVLVDVYMPDLDGFELARMIREHPRFKDTAIIFISAVLLTDVDFMRGYESGAVDYVSVPVVPEILRAKVRIFAELYRKRRQLERLNRELEERVAERTAALEATAAELRQNEEGLRHAVRELDHRAKNLLAIVQSVLRLSKAESTAEFIAAVTGRIRALSLAHSLLAQSRWQGVELARLVEAEMAPLAGSEAPRIAIEGPPVALLPASAQSLAIALHELATNAARHGALSRPEGKVAIRWAFGPERLDLQWVEHGGPPAAPPVRRGFGINAVVASVERQLGGAVAFDWRREGLKLELRIPRDHVHAVPSASGDGRCGPARPAPELAAVAGPGATVLLVEDEALIGAMFKELLGGLGFQVLGPVGDLAEALAAAEREDIRGAVLDVNLGGKPVYPVAEALAARAIPFVFVTGYSPSGIDPRFAEVPVLEKPIDPDRLRELFLRGSAGLEPPAAAGAASALAH